MAEIQPNILKIIEDYIFLLENKGFSIKEAYLFGSYAHGTQNERSDIDIAIISEKFEGNRFLDKEKIRGLYRQIDLRISTLPLNKEGLSDFFIRDEVIQKGIKLF